MKPMMPLLATLVNSSVACLLSFSQFASRCSGPTASLLLRNDGHSDSSTTLPTLPAMSATWPSRMLTIRTAPPTSPNTGLR